MASPLSHHLPHFAHSTPGGPAKRMMPLAAARQEPPTRVLIAEAEERGRRAGLEEARAEAEQARQNDLAAFEVRLGEERRQWIAEAASRLSDQLAAALGEMETVLVESVARVLTPFVDAAVRERALAEFAQTLARLRSNRSVGIRISGPEALLARVRASLEGHGDGIEYSVDDKADLKLLIDDTIVETRIGAWAERIAVTAGGGGDG